MRAHAPQRSPYAKYAQFEAPLPRPAHCHTQGFAGDDMLGEALTGCNLVIIPAGMPRKPGMSRDDLFKVNASIVQVHARPPLPRACRYTAVTCL